MDKILENKKILITAGPVWVPIDRVRVMTNTFGGALGAIIAQKAYELGADVTLLMGPGRARLPEPTERFNIIKFKYYEEILSLVKEHVGAKKHELMIHSAAVADYTPVETGAGK
ncbi:MAG: phosphopantothenoylcysteine decarboxylase, partial [bacterium]|nr:phosphopantothenoylcysteine decarboxylase [bacterium]